MNTVATIPRDLVQGPARVGVVTEGIFRSTAVIPDQRDGRWRSPIGITLSQGIAKLRCSAGAAENTMTVARVTGSQQLRRRASMK